MAFDNLESSPDDPGFPVCSAHMLAFSSTLFPYKVQDGDTIGNIAERIGCDWEELALLNFGTDVPEEINWHLEHQFVCTKKSGNHFVFSSGDEPGILFLPRPLSPESYSQRRRVRGVRFLPA